MPRFSFTFEPPNAFIYLGAILRPKTLRPHLRVPNITNVDFVALKRAGFNAVVIDKDNCLTIPETDSVHPSLTKTWNDLKATFPGRVLVVSNSAGLLSKDPGAIAAESVSLSLQAPILVRKRAKPGCAPSIISYFSGELGKPTTLRGTLRQEALRLREEEEEEESNVVKKWEDKFTGPILGPLVDKDGREIGAKEGDKSEKHDHELGGRMRERQHTEAEYEAERGAAEPKNDMPVVEPKEDLRILVIGDRMMTDTLLANRLAKHLSSPTSSTSSSSSSPSPNTSALPSTAASASTTPLPSVLSIHTTLLLQPKDVRPLRYIEEKLTRGRVREDTTDWWRYTKYQPPPPAPIVLSWKERINPLRDTPAPTWNPKTWKPASLVVALGLGMKTLGRGLYWVGGRVWEGEVEVAKVMAERAELAKKEAERKEAVAVVVEEVTVTPKKSRIE